MTKLTEYTRYADAQAHADGAALWDLFDGNREQLNIAHECIVRHALHSRSANAADRAAVRIAHAEAADEILTFEALRQGSARFAHWLESQGIQPGDRIAFMLEP